uniref:Vta1 C-terminal domain-containing protein n=1 Tax=Bionectria ochroleuca TaxID=29856 RepID=A0A8H7N076_BIOOC
MVQQLPASLKIPEVYRFVNRANQLRNIKPAIAYWCEYHAVNQIVAKGIHTSDDEAYAYTKYLLENLEKTKTEHPDDDSIVDNDAAQAYVEMFAQETLDRAGRTMHANSVTRTTADTFEAAATFFDLLSEWGEIDPEVTQKIKYAKYHAARILKAIREGRDPNESNPKEKPAEEDVLDETLMQDIVPTGTAPQPVSVQDVPDAGEPSPLEPSPPTQQTASVSDGYFPPVPSNIPADLASPSAPTETPPPQGPPSERTVPIPSPHAPPTVPSQFAPTSPSVPHSEPTAPPLWSTTASTPSNPSVPPPIPSPQQAPFIPQQPPAFPQQPAAFTHPSQPPFVPANPTTFSPIPPPQPPVAPAPVPAAVHYKDINQAQKHAKFAISALNFDDVPTAVAELRKALAALGTQ